MPYTYQVLSPDDRKTIVQADLRQTEGQHYRLVLRLQALEGQTLSAEQKVKLKQPLEDQLGKLETSLTALKAEFDTLTIV